MSKEAVIRASELYRSGGKVLRRVAVGKESLIIESNGYPIVALLPYAEYEAFKLERARQEAEKFLADQQTNRHKLGLGDVSDDEVMAEALEAVEQDPANKTQKALMGALLDTNVQARPHIQKRYTDLVTPERRTLFVAVVESLAVVPDVKTTLEVVSDPADNPVLAAAVDGQANYLVTGDPPLLAIKQYAGCQIVTPDLFLAILAEQNSTD